MIGVRSMRRGQVAIFLVMVLTAIAVLVFMNVDIFLAVRAKNHATNAGDAAAIAVAKYQGTLLNAVGEDNLAQLQLAVYGHGDKDRATCAEIMERQRRRIFLDPLDGVRIGSEAAKDALAACETGGGEYAEEFETAEMKKILDRHVFDVRGVYAADTDLYPEPWRGAWEEYAVRLELAIGGDLIAGPENAEFADAYSCFPLLDQAFYNAVAGEQWCWFKWNGDWLFDRDHHNMPRPTYVPDRKRDNGEIYSLHLSIKSLPAALDDEWTNVIIRLTGCTGEDIAGSEFLNDGSQSFVFYDSRWDSWKDSGFSVENGFPIIGDVKPEYDVYGCAALCRVIRGGYPWTAAAKPFGTVLNLEDETDVVTCLKRFVTPAFSDVRLVPVDSVGGRDLHTADCDWMTHVRDHLPSYFVYGPAANGCWYCKQLLRWELSSFREKGQRWLRYYSDQCVRPQPGSGCSRGGTAHAH